MDKKFFNITDISSEFNDISTTASTNFYSIIFTAKSFSFLAQQNEFTPPTIDELINIFNEQDFNETSASSYEARINNIPINESFRRILDCCSFKGNPNYPDILEDPTSNFCKEAFDRIVCVIEKYLGPGNFNSFEIMGCEENSFFDYFASWGFCLLILNVKNGKGVFLKANPIF